MRRFIFLSVGALFLSGCAIPFPFQIASWALDGLSIIVTKKSVSDHGISVLAQKDCAVWRGITEGELCRNAISGDTMVAEDAAKLPTQSGLAKTASFGPRLVNAGTPNIKVSKGDIDLEVSLPMKSRVQVHALPSHALRASFSENIYAKTEPKNITVAPVIVHAFQADHQKPYFVVAEKMMAPVKVKLVQVEAITTPSPKKSTVKTVIAKAFVEKTIARKMYVGIEPIKGIYFVIGSFRNPDNAKRLIDGNSNLSAVVLSAKLDGTNVYRVVVGPVPNGREKRLHGALARNGFSDTWAIRVDPSDWRFAELPKSPSKITLELAALQK